MLLDIQLRKPGVYVLHAGCVLAQPHHMRQAPVCAGRAVWAGGGCSALLLWGTALLKGM